METRILAVLRLRTSECVRGIRAKKPEIIETKEDGLLGMCPKLRCRCGRGWSPKIDRQIVGIRAPFAGLNEFLEADEVYGPA